VDPRLLPRDLAPAIPGAAAFGARSVSSNRAGCELKFDESETLLRSISDFLESYRIGKSTFDQALLSPIAW
jgi:hypothetical protein